MSTKKIECKEGMPPQFCNPKYKDIDSIIRYHYWTCKCGKNATYLQHTESILRQIMDFIDYKPRVTLECDRTS